MLLLLEHHIYRFYDSNFRMSFAIDNNFIAPDIGPGNFEVGLLAKAIVPTAVPRRKPMQVLRTSSLARLCIHGIWIGREVRLRLHAGICCGAITVNIVTP